MKKLGRLKLNPEKLLSHDELVSFKGGSGHPDDIGSCGLKKPNGEEVCGISKQAAMAWAAFYGGYWADIVCVSSDSSSCQRIIKAVLYSEKNQNYLQ